jgi:hypothetical protein
MNNVLCIMFCIDAARGIFLAQKDVFDNCGEWPQPKPIENAWGPTPEEKNTGSPS